MKRRLLYLQSIIAMLIILLMLPLISYGNEIDYGQYVPTIFPDSTVQTWTDLFPDSHGNAVVSINQDDSQLNYNDALYIDSTGNYADIYYFARDINANNSTDLIDIEVKVRLDAYAGRTDWGGCAVSGENNDKGEVLLISPSKIRLFKSEAEYSMDTTDDYHIYRMVVGNGSVKVYVDGGATPVINATLYSLPWGARNIVAFGDGSGGASSESSWAYVEYSVTRP